MDGMDSATWGLVVGLMLTGVGHSALTVACALLLLGAFSAALMIDVRQ